ncbi:FkbM family methyltransferase [Streptomyces olivaceus]|uniref:FkbM family methyltransferase n=1 Tax=Streptomyces olivaceus TaxID=47716 RepID=UPI001CC99983|nr:FkbM family methyltransferase [Streptomyces olivaceus]MBZ6295943.1 FkbM family methyltransferase [Streptomyces olivaceus]MBZ6330921.1 FkbM family methyltransferase [Streptomyces olivaceus]
MSEEGIQLIELEDGFHCYTSSEAEARFIHREIFQGDTYDLDGLPEAPVVVDAGANIGLFTLFVKRRYPAARVIAFEPVPDNVRVLRKNLRLHGIHDVTVHPVCLGAEPAAAADFTYFRRMPGNSTRHPESLALQKRLMAGHMGEEQAEAALEPTRITVPVDRLSDVLAARHPGTGPIDLVKIDVEGAELDLLRGVDPADWARTRAVIIEVSGLDGVRAQVERALRESGLTVSAARAPFMWPELELYNVTARR